MLVWQRIIRGILLVILVAAPAVWYFGYEERSYAALYLTRSDYQLEEAREGAKCAPHQRKSSAIPLG
jgi:hypothetical protein